MVEPSHTLIRTIPVGFKCAEVYDFASDMYFFGRAPDPLISMSTGIIYASIPAPEDPQDFAWTPFEIGKAIMDFASSIADHNLLVAVT